MRTLLLSTALLATLPGPSSAALYDEIQVYTDSINDPGQIGLEVHVNTTPSGRSTPDFPGEVVPRHSLRVTPEISLGVTRSFDVGLYLPFLHSAEGSGYFAGPKLRMKWLPQRPDPVDGGWFWGINMEFARVGQQFEASRTGMELRPIIGYRNTDWLVAANPNLEYDLSPGYRRGGPSFAPSVKVSRRMSGDFHAGVEYYADLGPLANPAPRPDQEHTVYLISDIDIGPLELNLGVGKGLTGSTDRWTVKAIFGLAF